MRRDTQIGIILGVAILVIIGVFLSTRTSVKEPKLQEPAMSDEDVSEIEEIDVSELARGPKDETTEISVYEEESTQETSLDASSEDDTFIEGQWGGVGTDVAKDDKDPLETSTKDDFKELLTTIQNLSEEEEEEEEQQTTDVDFSKEITHKVKLNDSLSRISQEYYGDESKWREIYKANKDIIQNPNTLRIGMVLQIPDISSSARKTDRESISEAGPTIEGFTGDRRHTVRAGDTLYKLAEKYYGNPSVWKKIYSANKDILEDTNSLKIGQEIIIPE